MYKGQSILCVIPARGGSKGLPGKNLRELGGKPLIAHSIEQALASRYVDRVVVSTDDAAIAAAAAAAGAEVPFVRPAALATDDSGSVDVLLHALDWLAQRERYAPDALLLLQPTSPLRAVGDIERCTELLVDGGWDNVISVAAAHANPYFSLVERVDGKIRPVKQSPALTRQSAPAVYELNGAVYLWRTAALRHARGLFLERTEVYVMPRERSVDIDDLLDFKIAELLLGERPPDGQDR
jgi:CMP-N-acetylneuraminic acid synthetase